MPESRFFICLAFANFLLLSSVSGAPSIEATQKQFLSGDYETVASVAEKAMAKEREEEWRSLLMRAQLALGRYPDALITATNALKRYPWSLRIRLNAYEALQANGQGAAAAEVLDEMNELAGNRAWAYRDPENEVAVGTTAVLLGADPKLVLDNFYEPAKRKNPKLRDPYLAAGQLALDKQDLALASKYFTAGLKEHFDDPDLQFGMARAFAPDNRPEMVKHLDNVFKKNPRHVPGLLLLVDHMIDSEAYDEAEAKLKEIEKINPNHPELWAYRAVIAHVHAKESEEKAALDRALKFNSTNPRVAHLVGLKLSQKYRFQEGAEFQRRALAWDGAYLPARFQLAQDLLRLGDEGEGWELAETVHKADAYNVGAYNLVTLKDTISKFETFTNENFTLRMDGLERSLFGDDVLQLLTNAHAALCAKYEAKLGGPTTVEIFPAQKDFAIRTFGMPGGEGYLGVCFGRVITANSPASQGGRPSNWQAMLWHEFCHVVTLQLTRNRMPRWLSEGISVYEERAANPTWGQQMNPRYREMILNGDMKSIDDLTSAFMAPETDTHLQFAYYQSYLVVEFIVQKYGHKAVTGILRDLAEGTLINDAIAKHTTKLADLDKDFKLYATSLAEGLAPKLDWTKPKFLSNGELDPSWSITHPNNYWVLDEQASKFIEEKKWGEAKSPLLKLVQEYPTQIGPNSAMRQLAQVHRALNEADQEISALRKIAARDAEALDVYLRLAEMDSERKDWENALRNAERARAVNPLIFPSNQRHFLALRELGKKQEAIRAGEKVLRLNPPDPAGIHYELGNLLVETNPSAARRHIVEALEEAPRFRAAQKMLLKLSAE